MATRSGNGMHSLQRAARSGSAGCGKRPGCRRDRPRSCDVHETAKPRSNLTRASA
ncbi:hypothetical protein ACFPRL_13910 [Pseudoclavibacter helvolus]